MSNNVVNFRIFFPKTKLIFAEEILSNQEANKLFMHYLFQNFLQY